MSTSKSNKAKGKRRRGRPDRGFVARIRAVLLPAEIDEIVARDARATGRPMTTVLVAALAAHWSDQLPPDLVAQLALTPNPRTKPRSNRIDESALDALDQKDWNKAPAAKAA